MNILQEAARRRNEGQPFVLATIVRTAGSSPRADGAQMLIEPNGAIVGTIGGGNFEKMVIDDAVGLLSSGTGCLLKTYRFARTGDNATDMCCGGEADVFLQTYGSPGRLLIFGAGHIARELVRAVAPLGFRIVIVDDRPEMLEQFARSVQTVPVDDGFGGELVQSDSSTYIVIVTRSHDCDRTVLANMIEKQWAYIGMIGSRAKIAKMLKSLADNGVDSALLQKVNAPIGLEIGAEGPAEIAVAIAAKLIEVRARLAPPSTRQ